MFANNPFAELGATIPPAMMQAYVVLMFVLVVVGTIVDTIHKKSAKYFFENAKKAEKSRKREIGGGEKVSIAIKTVAVDVLTSGEFCNPRRRVSHLLTMYGFILFALASVSLVFGFPGSDVVPTATVAMVWHLGAVMNLIGGLWFYLFIRVDVSAEGVPWTRLVQADMFIVSLLGTTGFGLIWSLLQAAGVPVWTTVFFGLFVISATVLFGGVLWSKFAHMFFKPAAAYQKRIIKADGSLDGLPEVGELTDPALQKRYPDIPEYMGTNPPYMGLGIKRERPQHY